MRRMHMAMWALVLAGFLVSGESMRGQTIDVLHNFTGGTGDAAHPAAALVGPDNAGNLYGTTVDGGTYGLGTVFKLCPAGNETFLHSFTGANGDGANPQADLVLDDAGNLYGTTRVGGANGAGTVFKLDPAGNETVLHSFTGLSGDGAVPEAGLVRDAAGSLYGTTISGGTHYYGTVFKLDPAGNEAVLYSFTGFNGDGAYPQASLVLDAAGNLYGTTEHGGTNDRGTVFKLDPVGHETVLYSFTCRNGDGCSPRAGLIRDAAGNLYGTTSYGDSYSGTVFTLDPSGNETVLYRFTGVDGDGSFPEAGLIRDHAGNLYGTTSHGGADNTGTVFKLDPSGNETVLYSFTALSGDGANPWAGLVLDDADNLYGTTRNGGTNGLGTVFKLDQVGNEMVLYSFTAFSDGANPYAGLIRDLAGNLYGTTVLGGTYYPAGTVFKLDQVGNETVLHSFTAFSDGANPYAGLIRDLAGNLYGTTPYGGAIHNVGTVFKIDPVGNETVLYSFTGLNGDGANPYAGLIRDLAGNLYGTTAYGGTYDAGTVFKIDPVGNETVLYRFTGLDGANPQAGLVLDAAGNLYGTTERGGTNYHGTVFKLDPAGNETVLYSFTGVNGDGASPQAGLIRDDAGNLYGTTFGGGIYGVPSGFGTVFMLDPAGNETVLHRFAGVDGDGANPYARLVFDDAGNLYGTTTHGGTNGQGIVFRLQR